jgi:Zinc-finger domain of monoamine-oxidase A repressor R1
MTIKSAWNRTTIDTLELSLSETLPTYRHVCRDEQYKNKAIVHQSLLELSRFSPQSLISSPFKLNSFMRLFRLYTTLLIDEFIPADLYHTLSRIEKIPQHFNVTCSFCRTNIWNRFLTCKACLQIDSYGELDSYDICLECFSRGRSCRDVTNLEWVQQEKWSELMILWERCRGIYQILGGQDIDDFNTETTISLGRKTLAGLCVEELLRRPNPHTTRDTISEGLCHTCKYRHPVWKMMYCTSEGCNRAYCFGNLFRQFDEDPFEILSRLDGYKCPFCRGICNCGACRKRKDQIGYEPKLRNVVINPKLVADKRSIESLVDITRTNTRVCTVLVFMTDIISGISKQKERYLRKLLPWIQNLKKQRLRISLYSNMHHQRMFPTHFLQI